jgi:hypothetical protein
MDQVIKGEKKASRSERQRREFVFVCLFVCLFVCVKEISRVMEKGAGEGERGGAGDGPEGRES